jgi:hypothetical protein
MSLSKQVTPSENLWAFGKWADAAGYHVGENPKYGGVTDGAHAAGSWHYDGLAFDINWGISSPASERAHLLVALEVAGSMGLAVIFARDGVSGVAANHRNHLHTDVGEWSNVGTGDFRRHAGDLKVWKLQRAVRTPASGRDNLWGPDTDKRLRAVQQASELLGPRFPYGVKYTQDVVGVRATGKWGDRSRAAHDAAVVAVQRALGVAVNGVWGPDTDHAYQVARKAYRR